MNQVLSRNISAANILTVLSRHWASMAVTCCLLHDEQPCFIATLLLTLLFILALHSTILDGNRSTLAGSGTNKHAYRESFTPGGVTHTLGRNDRGVTPTGESFIPLTQGRSVIRKVQSVN